MTKKPHGYWNVKSHCLEDAANYSTKKEFTRGSYACWDSAKRNGWLEECCSHMVNGRKRQIKWTLEACKKDAARFKTRKEWQRSSSSAYSAAHKNCWLEVCCSHMVAVRRPQGYWTVERCREDAVRFETRSEWRCGANGGYSAAVDNGWLEECCSHMSSPIRKHGHWTKENCIKDASAYDARWEWALSSHSAYTIASRNGWLDAVAEAAGLPRFDGTQAQRSFAYRFRDMIAGTDIELREEVSGLAGPRTKVDMAFYRDGVPFLVVEYHGLYWHSEASGKDKHYHRKRMEALRERGIRLITVYENQADNPVIEQMIRGALGLVGDKVRASKCRIVLIGNATARGFYDATHIQGGNISGKDKFHLGLEDKDGRLVACMTFVRADNRHTGSGNFDWCLHRFATSAFCRVHGAAGRLFKRFREMHPVASVVSYCDLQHFTGATYVALGFDLVRENAPDYAWTRQKDILPKYRAQRKRLPALLGDNFRVEETERENMERAGYSRIWDCGKDVYAYAPAPTAEIIKEKAIAV